MEFKELDKTGIKIPVIGLGTWGMGGGFWIPDCSNMDVMIKLIREAIGMGYTMIDTAEMYGGGCSERIIGEAIKGLPRNELFIISKVWPTHARHDDVLKSAKASSDRLGTYIDLYMIHWPARDVPIKETMQAMEELVDEGVIKYIGVSNFDVVELEEARRSVSKYGVVADEVRYNLLDRDVEKDLIPYAEREGITIIAYSPLGTGSILRPGSREHKLLEEVGSKYNKTPAQVLLNWVISKPNVVAIPKAAKIEHLRENMGAVGWRLDDDDVKKLEQLYTIEWQSKEQH
ncbi:aldo/keto reductase [Thermocladium modestius]|uniref:Aldo/keto reductase n=1 Tax=Thermocladium modestius TaxID=62609 RepID=A0A830GS68_9CREN|nr:aldo/keto reductase [Thermocladium modestius]GGP19354.1 aldo/keto reductase [Thermocladium modestius]